MHPKSILTRRVWPLACMMIAFAVALSACSSGGNAPGETTLERIQREGTVRVGFANEAPYAYLDTASGELTGEAPEVLRHVLAQLGVTKVEGVLTEFGSLIPGLKAGRFDIIAAGMYITPKRCEQALFTNPTYSVGEAFAVAKGNPKELHSYADIREHADARIGVVAGAVEQGYAKELGIPADRVVVFPDAPSALEGLRAGRVDAYAGTALTVQDLLNKSGGDKLERADPFEDPVIDGEVMRGYGAYVLRQEDIALEAAINERLAEFIGSAEHRETVAPFNFTEQELPGDKTAAELCGL